MYHFVTDAGWSLRAERGGVSPIEGRHILDWMNSLEVEGHRFVTWTEFIGSEQHIQNLYIGDEQGNCPIVLHYNTARGWEPRFYQFNMVRARRRESWEPPSWQIPGRATVWRWDLSTDEFCDVGGLSVSVSFSHPDRYAQNTGSIASTTIMWSGRLCSDLPYVMYL